MIKIIATAAIYLLTMLLAYVLKKMGLFHKEDKRVLSNLIFYVTLPASLISGFSGAQVNIYYVVSILIGFGVNTVMVIAGQLAAAHKERDMQAIYAVNASGFNMACIAIPFLSNFYPAGVPYLCMFDVGDSFYTLGTTYAIAKMRINQKNKEQNTSEIKLNKSDIKTSDDSVLTVNSPLVGVFYSSASPEADAYVAIGDRVKKGQVIGIVEAMKLMNEIESDYDGVVTDILVDNEQMVEYGQPMFVIKPV